MSCMIQLTLRDSATDLKTPKHRSHKSWFKSLAILRDILDGPDAPIGGRSYCCVDQEDPKQVFYLWEKCSDDHFKTIKATCTSTTSELSRRLSPLLEKPLTEESIWRLPTELRMMHPYDFPYSCLEFVFVHNAKRAIWLPVFLDAYAPGGSNSGLGHVPVNRYALNDMRLPNGDQVDFFCIEWQALERREEVFSEPALRQQMKRVFNEKRPPILQALGKTEEELTWEEDLQVFFDCTGPEKVHRQFVMAYQVNDEFLDSRKKRKKDIFPCAIL